MSKKTIRDTDVAGRMVLVRVDFNVPLDEATGTIIDDSRIRAALPTIQYLREQGAKVILCSHLGRPKGKVADKLRLAPIAQRLSQVLGQPVRTTNDCIGPKVAKIAAELENGDVLLLENLRFHAEEEKNDATFARNLASLAELYVNDAFGTSHRAHASVVGVTAYLPAVAGLLLEKEIKELSAIIEHPAHPFAAVLGGAKVSDKVSLIENIMDKVDDILVGGGMAATFLKAKSYETGASLLEAEKITVATELMAKAARSGVNLVLPTDVVLATEISATAKTEIRSVDSIAKDSSIVDIGPATIESFRNRLRKCKTVFWNGPMGIYEIHQFAQGTKAIAKAIAALEATTVIGGGSTADAVADMGLTDQMTFVSTGGGASLEFLSGDTLPGIAVIPDKER